MQPPFAKLTKAILITITAVLGNVNAMAPNRILDETVQVNPSDSLIAVKSERRSGQRAGRVVAATEDHRGKRAHLRRADEALADDSRELLAFSDPYMMPHTLFGAGSMALSALGNAAPVPLARS
ncbi:MAG: hypothetical protein ACTHKH_00330 [Trinickia sp.]|jgi:hypothetical protein